MASGHLSPFPSYASGLGFLPTTCPSHPTPPGSEHSPNTLSSPHPSYHSLLTPTASVCTISSLSQCGDTGTAEARARTKTMQTKDILKSPQPHRFQLVLSSTKRLAPEPPALGGTRRPSTQWRYKEKGPPDSPRSVESKLGDSAEDGGDGYDLFSPDASPLIPETALCSPQSPYAQSNMNYNEHTPEISYGDLSPHIAHGVAFSDTRPTSVGSTLSAQVTSVSFTLVQDQSSKRFSSASGTMSKDYDAEQVYVNEPVLSVETVMSADEVYPYYEPTNSALTQVRDPDAVMPQPTAEHQRDKSNTVVMVSHSDPSSELPNEDHPPHSSPTPSPKSARHTTAGSLNSPSQSPSKQPPTRDRRKFALRRQAIYAEYGFQIALPDSDSETSVKLLASPSRRAMQGRTAFAYVLSGSNSRSALSVSCSGSMTSSTSLADLPAATCTLLGDTDSALFAVGTPHCAQATDRLERYSVQDDILGATRNPLLDTLADLTTSTPPKSRSTNRRSPASTQAPCAPVPDVPCPALPCNFKLTAPGNVWQPLRIQKRNPVVCLQPKEREQTRIPLSKSERRARLSAYEVDHGHHPIMQALVDDVERAIEQWRWTAQLRVYL
ncbi:hypothetical protein C8Q78DRAFT_37202 [Trametes maxima]|nr:hypothetical protein C8Q78DRAFT_37202 [Trametes maxima]